MSKVCAMLLMLLGLAGCSPEPKQSQLYHIYQNDILKVGILHDPTSYYIGPEGPVGFELELSQALADKLSVKLELYPSYHLDELIQKLQSGQVDFIAGGLTVTQSRLETFRAAPPYRWINEVLVYKQGNSRPRSAADIKETIFIVKDSSHVETLQQLNQQWPDLPWQQHLTFDSDDLLQQVEDGNIAYTITDSNQLALNRRFFPNLSIAFNVKENLPVSWFLKNNGDDSLYAVLIEFFGAMYQNEELITLEDKYFGHIQLFDYVDTLSYINAIEKTLPKYKDYFIKHAGELDWRLLAAVGYQESHWKAQATSPTGVRGLMMLTLPTAQEMGISSRLDPEQSILGGSRYLQYMISRVPERISMPDRLWFALAAYNVGLGHIEDARVITQKQGADPDKWLDVKQRLPLLRQKSFYQHTRHGYARGDEPVTYVENIRRYYDTLIWIDEKQQAEARLEMQKNRLNEELNIETTLLPPEN